MKTFIIVTHPHPESSVVNKRWVEELKKHPEHYAVHELHTVYPDGNIDVKEEQKLVESHGNLILQFPVIWSNCPYLLKKWLDVVLIHGWAYGLDGGGKLAGRKVALAVTAVIKEECSEKELNLYNLEKLLTPFEMTFRYMDADYRPFFAIYGAESDLSAEIIEQSAGCYIEFLDRL
ncbi:NAD(P)H-dependent oxidoreductase [Caproiciproducens sp.]|uniref:NAD(P)H-dependent oxidoreductase n=1 Tax=Caproiciproducens sp. TaxID=1954376 RepID=UPI00289B239D|nr:NAD(P)H-dependent oxidoreductase [Caproiciproducens sp.]